MKWYSRFESKSEGSWSTFYFRKSVRSTYRLDKSEIDQKYNTLKSLNFKNVHIPNFSYEIKDYEIIYNIEYVKGKQLNPLSYMIHANTIYDSLINNENEWGFHDLKCENFITEIDTDKLYFVDFESFEWMTHSQKIEYYNKSIEHVLDNLNRMKKNIYKFGKHSSWPN